ncbi:MAG: hypothetical protein PHR39_07955, partial [Actinomycetota bacterium]|nr:hypothetical protein [Actinomycetota bacterium]
MFAKKIVIIIISLIFLASLFQALRSFGILKFVKNVNSKQELESAKSPDIPAGASFEKYLIVFHDSENNSVKTKKQVEAVLKYMKKDFDVINIDEIETGAYG